MNHEPTENNTRVTFGPASPWDDLREAPTALSKPEQTMESSLLESCPTVEPAVQPVESPSWTGGAVDPSSHESLSSSSGGLPSLVVPYDARFTPPPPSDELPPLTVDTTHFTPVAAEDSELPPLIPRDEQPVGTELSPGQVELGHDQGESVEGKLHQVKELLGRRLRAVEFVREQLKGVLSALNDDDSDKLKWHIDKIRGNASQLKAIATTGSDILSVALSSVVGSQVGEPLSESQEKYNHLLESLDSLSARAQTDSIDLGNYHWRVGFNQKVTEVNGLIKGIRAVDQELIPHFNS